MAITSILRTLCAALALTLLATPMLAGPITDPNDPKLSPDFGIQGEYAGDKVGVQVIALDGGAFHAVVYPGGLPGAGWDGENRSAMQGKLEGDKAVFEPATGNRKYLGGGANEFSATKQFPPKGHQPYSATISGSKLTLKGSDGEVTLSRVERKSPTLGAEPPAGAKVLFSGKPEDMKHFNGGRFDEKTKLLNTDGKDIRTAEKYSDYTMHVEFMLPYKPEGRGQGRGNSGFYQIDMYEVQILDSFGLEGVDNECGGIYKKADPKINMCLPPLQWQTYDVEFKNAVVKDGKKVSNARITVRHNGVIIHDDFEIDGKTGGARKEPEGTPGPMKFQGHGNPVQFRNIWIVPKG